MTDPVDINRVPKLNRGLQETDEVFITRQGSGPYRVPASSFPWEQKGDKGDPGGSWAPVLALVTDGVRLVHRVVDWVGGTGEKPTALGYVGATGFVATAAAAVDVRGAQGAAGWAPVLAVVEDGVRRVHQVVDWTGGAGTKPTTLGYVGATGIVETAAAAVDVRGPQGVAGWAPVLAVVADGERRVQQVVDWTGGAGTKPTTLGYVGAAGIVETAAAAVDVRGAQGAAGWAPVLAVVEDGVRRVQRVVDWTGGAGTKPTTLGYVGAAGIVETAAEAVDVRGPLGTVSAESMREALVSASSPVRKEIEFLMSGGVDFEVAAGVTSGPDSAVSYGVRTGGQSGWGIAYVRDPQMAFDTISLPGLRRGEGVAGALQWATIVVEVVDFSGSFSATELIARGSVAVDPAANILPALKFAMLDPAGRPITLDDSNLPSRYLVRHFAINSSGGRAVCSEVKTASAPPYTLRTTQAQSGGPAGTPVTYAIFQDIVTGAWTTNGVMVGMAYSFSLASVRMLVRSNLASGPLLRNTLARLARLLNGDVVQANILMCGDSWVHGNTRFARPIARAMKQKYGDAGPGWCGFAMAFGSTPAGSADDSQASVARAGGWTDDATTSAKGLDAYSCSAAAAGDTVTVSIGGTARRAVLHAWAVPSGGSVRWAVNGGTWKTISLDAAAGMLLVPMDFGTELTGASLVIEVLTLGAGVTLHGIDLRRDTAGVRVHKMGHSGGRALHHYGVDEAITWAEVASLDPVLCLLCWTTNEINADTQPEAMIANIEGLMRRLRQVRPYIDFLIVSPFDNASEGNINIWSDYESALRTLARKWGVPFLPTRALIGTWGDANARGLIQDTIPHPAAPGGQLLSGVLMRDHLTLGL